MPIVSTVNGSEWVGTLYIAVDDIKMVLDHNLSCILMTVSAQIVGA